MSKSSSIHLASVLGLCLALSLGMSAALTGCGGKKDALPKPKPENFGIDPSDVAASGDGAEKKEAGGAAKPYAGATSPYPEDKATGGIAGTIKFGGKILKMKKIDTSGDPKCAAMHADAPLLFEFLVANDDGGLKNCLVYISAGLEKYEFSIPTEAAKLDQKGCQYIPHVLGVMAGQPIEIKNSDPTAHNIHSISKVNPEWNFSQAKEGQVDTKSLDEVESAFVVKCDIHPWMNCVIQVFEHPKHTFTDDKGKYEIKGIVPGEYTVSVFHEKYADGDKKPLVTGKVKVEDGKVATLDLTVK